MLRAISFQNSCLRILDQRRLPTEEVWVEASTAEEVAYAIEAMLVRGAPAIGCTAAWGIALDAVNFSKSKDSLIWGDYQKSFEIICERFSRTRPTAVNLFYAISAMKKVGSEFSRQLSMNEASEKLLTAAQFLEDDDIRTCKAIGDAGAGFFEGRNLSILTHCNTGSLATAGYGTALGIIRSLHSKGRLKTVFVDETRPYLQGARLTAYELSYEKIPYKLISDNMAAYAMQKGMVDGVVVGADRIASNGDTANKIGTYNLAVLCQYHKIPFVVAAPDATIDRSIMTGHEIPIEERPEAELKRVSGVLVAPENAKVWNPSFDVTPASLISAIVTEHGVFRGNYKF